MAARETRTRVLDEATRYRRQKKALEALEQDNFHDEPHADLVMSKKAPKFQEVLDPNRSGPAKKRKTRSAEFYKLKYGKNIRVLVDELLLTSQLPSNYITAQALPSKEPRRHFCTVCGFPAPYNCAQCGAKFCTAKCLTTHRETRCLKFTA